MDGRKVNESLKFAENNYAQDLLSRAVVEYLAWQTSPLYSHSNLNRQFPAKSTFHKILKKKEKKKASSKLRPVLPVN